MKHRRIVIGAPCPVRGIPTVVGKLPSEDVTVPLVKQNARGALQAARRGRVAATGEVVLSGTSEEPCSDRRASAMRPGPAGGSAT